MRILVLNYEFPPVGGGGGRVAEDICRLLARKGHSVLVQTSYVKGLRKVEERDGYKIYRTYSMRRKADSCSVFEMGTFLITNFIPSLFHAIRWKPDVIHVHFAVPTGVLALLINLLTKIPYVLTAHLGDVPGALPDQTDRIFKVIKPLSRPIWRRAFAVTAVSGFVRELALRSYDVPIETIPNGIELERYNSEPLPPNNPPKIVFAGRFNPQKNLFFLIEILKRASDLSWDFNMLGDGPLMNEVNAKVQNEGLSERIQLHGWVSHSTVDNIMSRSDILVLPSTSEGMPIIGAMALGHGLAILGSDIGGLKDVVLDGLNGNLCPVNDIKAFEMSLRKMLTERKILKTMKEESKKLAKNYDLQAIVRRYEEIFFSVNTRGL